MHCNGALHNGEGALGCTTFTAYTYILIQHAQANESCSQYKNNYTKSYKSKFTYQSCPMILTPSLQHQEHSVNLKYLVRTVAQILVLDKVA